MHTCMVVRVCRVLPRRRQCKRRAVPATVDVVTMAKRPERDGGGGDDGGRFTIDGSGRNRTRDLRDLGRISAAAEIGEHHPGEPADAERGAQEPPHPCLLPDRPQRALPRHFHLPPSPNLG